MAGKYEICLDLHRCQEWFAERTGSVGFDLVICIGLLRDNELIGIVGFNYFNGVSCHTHIYFEENKFVPVWFPGYIFNYVFNKCGLELVLGLIDSDNKKLINIVEKLGYKKVFELVGAGSNLSDTLIFTLEKKDCRYI